MRWIFFILLLASFGAQAQNKEAKSFFISANDGLILLSGQKVQTVGSGTELDYDSKISFVNGVNIGYAFNSIIALDIGHFIL